MAQWGFEVDPTAQLQRYGRLAAKLAESTDPAHRRERGRQLAEFDAWLDRLTAHSVAL